MSVYQLNGSEPETIYKTDSTKLPQAYDIDGEEVWNVLNGLKVMTFNVGSWFGYAQAVPSADTSEYSTFFNNLFENDGASLAGIQEYYSLIGDYSAATLFNNHFGNLYAVDKRTSPTKAGRALASKYALSNTAEINFQSQSGEVRSFLASTVELGGKTIYFLTAHLALAETQQTAQIQELLDYVQDKEYWILTGDFNVRFDSAESEGYTALIEPFLNLGYHSANGSNFGFLPTFYEGGSPTVGHCIDNIFTSANIDITGVYTDESKFTAYNDGLFGWGIDHIPLIATVNIN